jgi:putative molybdopterin biosynthesis protein
MAERNLYLSNTPVEEAKHKYMAALSPSLSPQYDDPCYPGSGPHHQNAVFARYSSPLFNAAAMDGIAVTSAKTAAARETAPLELLPGEDYSVVDTGDPIRFPFDAVIMAEDITETENGVRIFASAAPGSM